MPGLRHSASRMATLRRRLGLAQDRFLILHAAGLAPRAGADTAILGLAILRTCWGVHADLIVVYEDLGRATAWKPQLNRLRTAAADLGITAQVRFTMLAAPAQMRAYHGAANAVAVTPWYASACTTTAAAMACARPIIGTRVGGVEDMVVDGLTGYLIPPRDAEALAARLAAFHRQPAQADAMGAAGRRHLRARRSGQPQVGCEDIQARPAALDDDRQPAWLPYGEAG